jgi:hypothetical protein
MIPIRWIRYWAYAFEGSLINASAEFHPGIGSWMVPLRRSSWELRPTALKDRGPFYYHLVSTEIPLD